MEKTSFSAADEPALKAAAIASIVKVPTLMEWRIKAHSHWIFPADVGFGSLAVVAWCVYFWIFLFMDESPTRDFF
jgi:hypothetical protein